MSVTSVKELWEGRAGVDTFTRRRTYTRTFEVQTDDPDDDAPTAGGTLLLPRLGDAHPEDSAAVVVSVRPAQSADSPMLWVVSVEYDTQPTTPEAKQPANTSGGGGTETPPGELPENPLARPPVWKIGFQQTTKVATKDRNGTRIKNSADLPFDPPITIEVSRPVITVTVNRAQFDLADAGTLQDAVNDDVWQGFAARTVRCIGIEAQSAFENGFAFWQVTYNFAINRDTWDFVVLDAGFAERILHDPLGAGPEPKWERITDSYGKEVTEPVPLNGSGLKLAPGDDPVYHEFRIYREVDFASLIV